MFSRAWMATTTERLLRPVDAAGLAAFRFLFGGLMFVSATRFLLNGWVEDFYVRPAFRFAYWGFAWVQMPPPAVLYAAFIALALLSLCIAIGFAYRAVAWVFFFLFTYVQLLDVSYYLNHYYLISLVAFIAACLPLGQVWSVDARIRPEIGRSTLPAWMLYLLRFQVGTVYFFAGLAKLGSDWLLHAQPLQIWLGARSDLPVVGAFFDEFPLALGMSWAGFLYDTTVVAFLLVKRTRPLAYAVLVVFHLCTAMLFQIGMFPYIMTLLALIFFEPDWPRHLWSRISGRAISSPAVGFATTPAQRWFPAIAAFWSLWCLVQLGAPLRTHLYGGNVLWHEQGMRWSWRVMVREKDGDVRYRVRLDGGRERVVEPCDYLTDFQEAEMSGQPDLILQLAHHIAKHFQQRGHKRVEVRADAFASLNGRPLARLIDPDVDLARIDDGLARADWILPAPTTPPIRLFDHRQGSL